MKMKLTEEDILNVIVKEEDYKAGQKTTVVCITLKNGFEVIGTSACVDPSNYDHEVGVGLARKRALDKVWELEGYLLQSLLGQSEPIHEVESINQLRG